jgi:metal-responsive CopG/Arc/MetJ family transcriptional regulator
VRVRVITVKLPEELLIELDTYAMNHRRYRSEVIREALKFYLNRARKTEENWGVQGVRA